MAILGVDVGGATGKRVASMGAAAGEGRAALAMIWGYAEAALRRRLADDVLAEIACLLSA